MSLPPKEAKVGALMARIISKARLPHATVDFPRYDEMGLPVAQVYMRPLTQMEQDLARANAASYMQQIFDAKRTDVRWKPEELEDNAVIAEILAVACRDPEDPQKPFFEHGVVETRMCTTDELSMLFVSYNQVRERSYPTLREMSEADMIAWVRVLEEDAEQFPFSRISRGKLEAFCVWAAKSLASMARQAAGTTSSS